MKSIYLVTPKSDPQAYFGAEVYARSGFEGAQLIADLSITTVAALAPPDFALRLCDEHINPVDLDTDADFVGLTGKTSQAARQIELADEFRRRGKVVILGGPFATLDPEAARDHCDILVRGEIEEIAPELFADLRAGTWKEEYIGTRPDLALSPPPRWDLYPHHRAYVGALQTSRGCPFECEFCDVPAYAGRKQRHKPPARVLAELDVLYRMGFRSVFIADDNFTVYRRRAKELLEAMRWWNRQQREGPMWFSTQVSLDAARDPELLRMCAEAGINTVFIGIESSNAESLRETRKRQNLYGDMTEQIAQFVEHRIMVIGGLIAGFDADGPDIFDRHLTFAQTSNVPIFSLGALVAPAQTPLAERLMREQRLIPTKVQTTCTPWTTNIVPKRMSHAELVDGLRRLAESLYEPAAFGERLLGMLQRLGPLPFEHSGMGTSATVWRPMHEETRVIIKRLYHSGAAERKMITQAVRLAAGTKPHALDLINSCLRFYAQVRCVYAMNGVFSAGQSASNRTAGSRT